MQQPPPDNSYFPPQVPTYQPQAPIQPAPKKTSRLWLWIVLCVVGVLLLGCIGFFSMAGSAIKSTTIGKINPSSTTTSSSTTSSSSSSNQSISPQFAKVGQTITVDNLAATLISVKALTADEYIKPKPGNEFIVVHVKLVNNSSDEKDYSPFDFHVRSGSGNITDEEAIPPQSYRSNNQLNSGKLSPGGNVEGDIVFQVPKHDHKAQLTWQSSIFGNAGDNAWNLGL